MAFHTSVLEIVAWKPVETKEAGGDQALLSLDVLAKAGLCCQPQRAAARFLTSTS